MRGLEQNREVETTQEVHMVQKMHYSLMPLEIHQSFVLQEVQRRTKEVAYNLNQRIRQELAYPSVVHIYTWLLHGEQDILQML